MPPHLTPARFVTCAVMAASALAAGCSSSTDQMRVAFATPVAAKALDPADPTDRSQYRYLYAVYCNGRVDRLDLKNQAKTGSFQLSERSGKPTAIAALPRPGVRPGGCLARPVVTQDAQGSSDGLVNIVASSRLDPDADGRKPYQLLTFALPGWTLQQARNLGSFDALPRLARAADGTLAVQPRDKEPAAAMAAQARAWAAADAMAWTSAQAWSAGNVLLIYALSGQRGMPGGMAVFTDRRGNYQFIALGQPFDSDPVMDDAQDDADGARPGLVYAAR